MPFSFITSPLNKELAGLSTLYPSNNPDVSLVPKGSWPGEVGIDCASAGVAIIEIEISVLHNADNSILIKR
jgi:hypothetical protein